MELYDDNTTIDVSIINYYHIKTVYALNNHFKLFGGLSRFKSSVPYKYIRVWVPDHQILLLVRISGANI